MSSDLFYKGGLAKVINHNIINIICKKKRKLQIQLKIQDLQHNVEYINTHNI